MEVCVDSVGGLDAAVAGGADRIELCSALALGGLTPSAGLMAAAGRAPVPALAMIRPRAGGFVWSPAEIAVMCCDIRASRDAGLAGVVLGASLADGTLDCETLSALLAEAQGMTTTLHRCFDLVPDPFVALEQAVALGFDRILTSGQAKTALEGIDLIAALHARASGRIVIMPGSGVTAENARRFTALGLRELHGSCSVTQAEDTKVAGFGFGPELRRVTSARLLQALVAASKESNGADQR
ncbi:copper homeostasis protein CutC [Paragemmobacter aquarius]|uniref:copper homeostasis protein CutC n=1 Tax=Paragemmobacter aquarius TaxID=2169400 RepID=UPI001E3E862D|nr:copper homeostasis protein CutC [Gemmobacter aquarius]